PQRVHMKNETVVLHGSSSSRDDVTSRSDTFRDELSAWHPHVSTPIAAQLTAQPAQQCRSARWLDQRTDGRRNGSAPCSRSLRRCNCESSSVRGQARSMNPLPP